MLGQGVGEGKGAEKGRHKERKTLFSFVGLNGGGVCASRDAKGEEEAIRENTQRQNILAIPYEVWLGLGGGGGGR